MAVRVVQPHKPRSVWHLEGQKPQARGTLVTVEAAPDDGQNPITEDCR